MAETEMPPAAGAPVDILAGVSEPLDALIVDPDETVPEAPDEAVFLQLTDLLPDESGEVVLFADEAVPVNIVAHEPVTGSGIAEAHVTASGLDVTGLLYYSFEGGITLYSPTDVLIIDHPAL